MHICIAQALCNVGHAVRGVGFSLRGLPATQLGIKVVSRQPQKARYRWVHSGQGQSVAMHTGGDVSALITLER